MSNPATEAVASFFHNQRKKRKPIHGADRLYAAAVARAREKLMDYASMTDAELIAAYNALEVDDPEVDRVAAIMEERDIDL